MRNDVVKLDFVIRNVFVAGTTHLTVAAYYFEHNVARNITTNSPILLRFCKGLGRKEHGTYVPKDRTTEFFQFVSPI